MNCLTCKLAEWDKTANGRLHPNKNGRCKWEFPLIVLPVAFYYIGGSKGSVPSPNGGRISRDERYLKDCPAWAPK